MLICCGYISLIRLIASVYCCSRAADALQCGSSGQNIWQQQYLLLGVSRPCINSIHVTFPGLSISVLFCRCMSKWLGVIITPQCSD